MSGVGAGEKSKKLEGPTGHSSSGYLKLILDA